jgi:hypothetical protein
MDAAANHLLTWLAGVAVGWVLCRLWDSWR